MIIKQHYLEHTSNGHNKFYTIKIDQDLTRPYAYLYVRWGKINTNGVEKLVLQSQDTLQIERKYNEILTNKLNKGYEVIDEKIYSMPSGDIGEEIETKTYYEKDDKFWAIMFSRDRLVIKLKFGKIGEVGTIFDKYVTSVFEGEEILKQHINRKLQEGFKPIW